MVKKTLELVPEAPKETNLSNVAIILMPDAIDRAKRHMDLIGRAYGEAFNGPDFKDIKGYQVAAEFFIVQLKDDSQYIYPTRDIARIKTYITKG